MPAALSTKEQILLAAERMIADRGVDGVSMRQIGTAVGSGNNSAVLYHFGSKEKLVEAIFEYRLPFASPVERQAWAKAWHALSDPALACTTKADCEPYRRSLEALTRRFSARGLMRRWALASTTARQPSLGSGTTATDNPFLANS